MTHPYVTELCNGSYILLESPQLIIGRNSDKSKPWELVDNRLLLPYQELSRAQIELSYDGQHLEITNLGRNRIAILLQTYDNTGSNDDSRETCQRKQLIMEPKNSLERVCPPCILSIHPYSFKDHYGTYYYRCPLFPPLYIVPIGSMVAHALQMLEKLDNLLSSSTLQSNQSTYLNVIFNRCNYSNLVLAEFVDCTDPQILGPLLDGTKKLVDLEPYYNTLTDITTCLHEAESVHGLELPIDPNIYKFEKPPCFPEHQLAYEKVCPQECHTLVESTDYKQFTEFTDFFLTDVTILSINANLQGLFEASMPTSLQAPPKIDILEWAITSSTPVLEGGRLCCRPDIGRLKSYYSRHKYLLIVYEESDPSDWIDAILEPEAEKNALFALIKSSLGTEKPIYSMSKKQFSGFLYHQNSENLSYFSFPPSRACVSFSSTRPISVLAEIEPIAKVISSDVEVSKEPCLRQSTSPNIPHCVERNEEVIDISDSEGSRSSSETKEAARPSVLQQSSQLQELPNLSERRVIKVDPPVMRIVNGYGVVDCDDISMSVWRALVDALNNDSPGPCLALRLCENDAE
ncbi:Hypothetical protein GLP15_3339 [Giardia lamblia P15]|uniref:Uncharacterized protein n=1 Tax=Giardia intestinalis (strain P15) TaxID=658858 RepID=E1EVT7_GIAIA|nr:Hypothetical protein GLP15_3339 [Giardia lamblia P15]